MKTPSLAQPAPHGDDPKQADADQVVKTHMAISLAVGLVPLPLADLAALAAIQLRMLSKLSAVYQVEFSEQRATSLIGSLVGAGGTALASSASYRLVLPLLPVGGWAVGMVSTAAVAAASTYALGRVFIQHFASGGTFLTLDPEKVRAYYQEQLAKGTAEVRAHFGGVKP
jgi:uncharacterized protein (DUF697 family)